MILLLPALLLSAPVQGATLADGRACLDANDVPCAEAVVEELGAAESGAANQLYFAARTSFYGGHYAQALDRMQRAVAAGFPDPYQELPLYERTAQVTADFTVVKRGRFEVRYLPGVDTILVEDAFEALEATDGYVAPLLGGPPPGTTILEIYPDSSSFIAASSLSQEAVETTGVVALSKWSRLLITSPRALGRGYPWQDTVSHEYIHLIVAHHTQDEAPVWLQEAIARYLDSRWHSGGDRFRLSVHQQGLLAHALAQTDGAFCPDHTMLQGVACDEDQDQMPDGLVSFDQMHPSVALLPSAQLAALAYAEVSSLLDYVFDEAGDRVLLEVLPRVEAGEEPREVLADVAGRESMDALFGDWLGYARGLDLVERKLQTLPTVIDPTADDMLVDPVLSQRADMQRWARLGDLLLDHGRPRAAMVEYLKAVPPDEPRSPLLSSRIARCWLELGDPAAAEAELSQSLLDYPEFPLSHKTLGDIRRAQGRSQQAIQAYSQAAALNPFNPHVQSALAELYEAQGDATMAERHARYLRILQRGGEG